MRYGAPCRQWPFSLIPMRYAAYHLRPYAKKLGAFIHFFMCMHFGEERDNEKLNNRENADGSGGEKKIDASRIHAYCISRMKMARRSSREGAGTTSIHRASFGTVLILRKQPPKCRHDENKRQQAS